MQEGENKTTRINLMQTSMTLGTYLGIYVIVLYAVFALSLKFSALSILSLPLMIGVPFVAYFLQKRFRDRNSPEVFPFPVSWMIAILMFLFSTILSCMAAYLYLRFIDHGQIVAGMKNMMDAFTMSASQTTAGMTDPAQIEAFNTQMETIGKYVNWMCGLPASGLTKILVQASLTWGNILSLIIGIITTKRIKFKQQ